VNSAATLAAIILALTIFPALADDSPDCKGAKQLGYKAIVNITSNKEEIDALDRKRASGEITFSRETTIAYIKLEENDITFADMAVAANDFIINNHCAPPDVAKNIFIANEDMKHLAADTRVIVARLRALASDGR
jgi:hypothetical protein